MLEKITAEELVGKGVIGMDDSPKLTAEEMQKKFEETAREVIVPKFNRLIEALTGESGAGEVGAADPVTGENVTVQKALESLLKATVHTVVQELTAEQRQTARDNIRALSWETDALEPGQQAQARANIGAASTVDAYGTVKYTEQTLSGEQKMQAVENIQAVSYRPGQGLGADGRTAARQNIDAAQTDHKSTTGASGIADELYYGHVKMADDVSAQQSTGVAISPYGVYEGMKRCTVMVEPQDLTEEQKAQARENIGASQEGGLIVTATGDTASHTAKEILAHVQNGGKAVLMVWDEVYNFAGRNPGMASDDDQNVAFLNVNGEDDDFKLAYITGRKVRYYRFNPGNKIPAPEKAKIGQVLTVKATDEFGYPTEWEAVDIGSGGMVVTVNNNASDKNSREIADHVKDGGNVVLKCGEDLYSFINYSEDTGAAYFIQVDPMDGEYFQAAMVDGNRVFSYKLPFALDREVVKTVNGVQPDENGNVDVDGASLIVTVTGTTASHRDSEIKAHVKDGGTVVLQRGEDLYAFINYSENGSACFMMVDPMDGEYLETATVDGNHVTFYKLPFALESEVVKTVNGVEPDENGNVDVAGASLIVTVTGTTASHRDSEIKAHVKDGGTVVLQRGEDLYAFINYSENGSACFMMVDPMDGEYLETATVDGNHVTFYKLPFALESEVVKTVNGVEPDENGNVEITGGGGADVSVGTTVIIPETHFSAEDGEGYMWDNLEGILFKMETPPVLGETYTMTVNGVSYEVVATGHGDSVWIEHEDADGDFVGIYYDPANYGEWGDFNSSFYSYYWDFEGEDGFVVPEPTMLSLARKKTTPGDVVIVKSVDENGKPKELETCNLLKREQVIFPKTYLSQDSPEWDDNMTYWHIKLNAPLIAGKTYTITVDGVEYTAVAEAYDNSQVHIDVPDVFATEPSDGPSFDVFFYGKESGTVSIKMPDGLPKLNLDYIDIAELKAALGL